MLFGLNRFSMICCRAFLSDDRLPAESLRFSVEVGAASDFEASPLQLRGVVKNAIVEAFTSHAIAATLDPDSPDIVFVVRRAGTPELRRTVVSIDIGGGARHRRRRARRDGTGADARNPGFAVDHVVSMGTPDRNLSSIR
jgi:hypothetical protein